MDSRYEPIEKGSRFGRKFAAACGVGALALLGFASSRGLAGRAATSGELASKTVEAARDSADPATLIFQLYKVALSVKSGDGAAIRDFANKTIAYMDLDFDLGCSGVKANGYLMPYGPQLHWVDAALLSNDAKPIDEWQDYFVGLNGDLTEFNAFLHNKVQMYHSELALPLARLQSLETDLILRVSSGYTGDSSPSGRLAHVLFTIAGRAYEIVGPVTSDLEATVASWPAWSDLECEASHRLDSNLDEYSETYASYCQDAATEMVGWARDNGYYPPMLAGVSVSVAADDLKVDDGALFNDLDSIASLSAYAESETASCVVTRVPTISVKSFKAPVRYVQNKLANALLETDESKLSVSDYNAYIHETHADVAGSYDDWAGWDHWMDQHIGLKYVGTTACAVSDQLNADLTVPVGQRTTADYGQETAVHWYTGYAGSMTWEYWLSGCEPVPSTDNQADVCACIASNNDKLYLAASGVNCTDAGSGDWILEDGSKVAGDDQV